MKHLILILTGLFLIGCGGGGSSSASGPAQGALSNGKSINGNYFFGGISGSDFYYMLVSIKDGHRIETLSMLFPNKNQSKAYIRKNIGTFSMNGDEMTITYSYETCDQVGTEKVKISGNDPSDRIYATFGATTIQFLNAEKWLPDVDYANSALTMIEDVNCNLM